MFGLVRPHLPALDETDRATYRSAYCGLCHTLGRRHGWLSRFGLSYDMTFLLLFLDSLYEPEDTLGRTLCPKYPLRGTPILLSPFADYVADMSVILFRLKLQDNWTDEGRHPDRWLAGGLRPAYERACRAYPEPSEAILSAMEELALAERRKSDNPDEGANAFGKVLSALFAPYRDFWRPELERFGHALGRFVYLADAIIDYERDRQKQNYNPFGASPPDEATARELLESELGGATEIFERLPLLRHLSIMKNILYAGVWLMYDKIYYKSQGKSPDGSPARTA